MMTNPSARHPSHAIFAALMGQPYALLVLAPTFWGGNLIAGKLAIGHISPFLLLTGRWSGALAILSVFALPHLRRDWPGIRSQLGWLIFYGIFGYASFNMLTYGAALFTSGVNISIEQASIPVMVLTANFLVFRVRPKPLQILGLLLTFVGVAWVATHGNPFRLLALDVNIGDGMVMLACAFYAAYSLTLRYRPAIHWLSFLFVTAFAAFLTSLLYHLVFSGGLAGLANDIASTTGRGWLLVLYVMLFPSILAQLFYAKGVELVGPNRASIFINLLPVSGTLLSIIILGETLQAYHLVAAVLVVGGISLSEYAVRQGPR